MRHADVNLQKGTRYALCAAAALARGWGGAPVTVAHVAAENDLPRAVVAKVFQQLVHAGLVVGTRGTRGGYRLARSPHAITVLDVIDVFESHRSDESARNGDRDVRSVIEEVDEMARLTFASITLDTLVGRRGRMLPALRRLRSP